MPLCRAQALNLLRLAVIAAALGVASCSSSADVGILQRALLQPSATPKAGAYHPGRLLVTLHRPPHMADAHSDHLPEGLDLDHVIDNSHAGDAHTRAAAPRAEDLIFVAGINNGIDAADMLTSIRDHPEVKHVELDAYLYPHSAVDIQQVQAAAPQVHPNDVFYECNGAGDCGTPEHYLPGQQWALNKVGAPQAWKYTTGSKKVKVGVIDTGVSIHHQDLTANTQKNCEDFVNGDGSCDEGSILGSSKGHGTHAAGVIGGTGNNGMGIAGMNWESDIVGCTMFPDNCVTEECPGSTSAAIKCLNWLRNTQGVRIVSNSYGCKTSDTPDCYSANFEQAINSFAKQGGLFVVSAGNDGVSNAQVLHYPADYAAPNVLSVAATSITTAVGNYWDLSNPEYLATWSDFGSNVDMAAPGGDIISTWAPASSVCNGAAACYARISGTSAAAPMVAGAAALIASMPGAPSGAALKALILKHVDKLSFLDGKVASGGRLNVFAPIYELATAASAAKATITTASTAASKKPSKSKSKHSAAYYKYLSKMQAQLRAARKAASKKPSSAGRRLLLGS